MFWGRDWDTLVVTNLDVTNATYKTFADCTWTGNWFELPVHVQFSLISTGNEFQITEPKNLKKFLPLRIEFMEGITSSGLDHKLIVLSLFTNNTFRLFTEVSWRAL